MNVWSLIKDVVGKGELSRVQTPVQFLEPLSELQQRCEDMEFSELLDQVSHLRPLNMCVAWALCIATYRPPEHQHFRCWRSLTLPKKYTIIS